jgi:hypothetical protein
MYENQSRVHDQMNQSLAALRLSDARTRPTANLLDLGAAANSPTSYRVRLPQ